VPIVAMLVGSGDGSEDATRVTAWPTVTAHSAELSVGGTF
jgi:hypothetical protein